MLPEDYYEVDQDQAIALLKELEVLERALLEIKSDLLAGLTREGATLEWVEAHLRELWAMRGLFGYVPDDVGRN